MRVIVNGLATEYEQTGSGKKTVLLLHGWGDTKKTFEPLSKELAKKYTVLLLDLPGFGGTETPSKPWRLGMFSSFVGAFLQKIEVKQLHAVMGHSNGGAIAIHGLAAGDFTSERLVLMGSAGIRPKKRIRNFSYGLVAKTGKLLTAPLPGFIRRRLRARLYHMAGSDYLVAEHMQETFKNIVNEDVRDQATLISMPTLILYGEHDTETPPAYGQIFEEAITSSEFFTVEGAGHHLFRDKPTVVTQKTMEFLNK